MADMDSDCICTAPIKSQKSSELIRAFEQAHDNLTDCGFEPALHQIDNETSKELIKAIKKRQLEHQVMSPSNHRRNPAEPAIRTFKSHFIAMTNAHQTHGIC